MQMDVETRVEERPTGGPVAEHLKRERSGDKQCEAGLAEPREERPRIVLNTLD